MSIESLRSGSGSPQFDGAAHGDAGVSFFVNRTPPGAGPSLHRHSYDEVFVVLEGRPTFLGDGETTLVEAGKIAIARAGEWHGFRNDTDEPLLVISIHPVDHMETEWMDEDS